MLKRLKTDVDEAVIESFKREQFIAKVNLSETINLDVSGEPMRVSLSLLTKISGSKMAQVFS